MLARTLVAGHERRTAFEGDQRVSPHKLALSDVDGELTLFADKPGSGIASLTKRRIVGVDFSHEETVAAQTFSSFVRSHGVGKVDVLKMDVEGHELDVLRGTATILRDIRVIQFEFGGANIDTRTYLQDYWRMLVDNGFSLYRLGPRGAEPIREYSERDEVFVTTNYFAVASGTR